MRSLHKMIERWTSDGLVLLPPESEPAVRATFEKVGAPAASDVVSVDAILGGVREMDKEHWRLWSLADIEIGNTTSVATGVLFSDDLMSCWSCRRVEQLERRLQIHRD